MAAVSAAVLAQVVLSGLGAGVAIALIALGVSVVGGLRGAVPLPQGDVAGGSVAVAVLAVVGAASTAQDVPVPAGLGLIGLALAAGAVGGGLLFGAARSTDADGTGGTSGLGSAGGLQVAATALALGLLARDGISHGFPRGQVGVADPLRLGRLFDTTSGSLSLGGDTSIPARLPGVIAVGGLLIALTASALRRSGFGQGVRALSQDSELAALSGVDAQRVSLGAYCLAGVLAAAGGVLAVPTEGLAADSGVLLGLAGLLAALAGGVGSLRGAVGASLAVGVFQAAVAPAAPAAAEPSVLAVLVACALLRGGGEMWVAHYR